MTGRSLQCFLQPKEVTMIVEAALYLVIGVSCSVVAVIMIAAVIRAFVDEFGSGNSKISKYDSDGNLNPFWNEND